MPNVINERDKAYVELVMARKELSYAIQVSHSLPKHLYSKRRNGKKVKFQNSAIRHGSRGERLRFSSPESKYNQFEIMRMKAQVLFNTKEEAFRESLKDFTEKKGGSIKDAINASSN